MAVLKVTLADVRPTVWRRVEVPLRCTLADLDVVLREAFDWSGNHLHEFETGSRRFAPRRADPAGPRPGSMVRLDLPGGPIDVTVPKYGFGMFARPPHDEAGTLVAEVAGRPGSTLTYTYDLGDCWLHRIEVEQVTTADPGVTWPRCLDGRGVVPEEDTGEPRGGAPNLAVASAVLRRAVPVPSGADRDVDLDLVGVLPELSDDDGCECGCDQEHLRTVLPAPPEPDPAALADEAARSPLVRRAVALAQWLGSGRAVTPTGVLRPADADTVVAALGLDVRVGEEQSALRSVAEPLQPTTPAQPPRATRRASATKQRKAQQGALELGLDDADVTPARSPGGLRSAKDHRQLHPLWSAALAAGLVEVRAGRAYAGAGLSVWEGPADDEARLTAWVQMLGAYLATAAEAARVDRGVTARFEDGLLAGSALVLYLTAREPAPIVALGLAVAGQLGLLTPDEDDEDELGLDEVASFLPVARSTFEHWIVTGAVVRDDALPTADHPGAQAVEHLLATLGSVGAEAHNPAAPLAVTLRGLLTSDPAVVQVGPLGLYGLARLLRAHGFPLRVRAECIDVHPTELLDRLGRYAPEDALDEARQWVEARGAHWERDVSTAGWVASGPGPEGPRRRLALPLLVGGCGPQAEPLLTTWSADRWLAVPVAAARAVLGTGPELAWAERAWLGIDELWPHLADLDDLEAAMIGSELPALLRHPGAAAGLARLDHPHAADVLRGVAFVLEDPAVSELVSSVSLRLRARQAAAEKRSTGRSSKRRR